MKSKTELDLYLFIKDNFDYTVHTSYRPDWLNGKELDIYIEELNLAIEYNGHRYHHSTKNLNNYLDTTYKSSHYHLTKYKKCKDNNVFLIHIFDFECMATWKKLLSYYLNKPAKYSITFKNIKRSYKDLNIFGKSNIEKIK